MADGTTKPIQKIIVGDEVLGVDQSGCVVPSKVINTFNNGRSEKWLRLRTFRAKCGRGNSFTNIVATPNHLFWSPKKNTFVSLSELKPGESVSVIRSDLTLAPLQKQILMGMLLGDATFTPITVNTASIVFGHVERHSEYLDYILRGLGNLGSPTTTVKSGYGSTILRGRTLSSYFIHRAFSSFIKDGIKVVPSWVAEEISPVSLAFWYMDDGSLGHHEDQEDRAYFAVCGFDAGSCQVLLRALKRFGVAGVLYGEDKRRRIRLNADEAEKFFLLIAPYIPPCMQYKLPERYRGHTPFLLSASSEYKTWLFEKEVISIEDVTETTRSCRYDIETETHNFFCPDVLVHNSNARYAYHDGQFIVGSHATVKANDSTNWWTYAATDLGMEERCKRCPGYILFGEVYGQVQKGYEYGQKKPVFVLFDVFSIAERKYVDWDFFAELARTLEIPHVPILYKGPWVSLEHAVQFSDGPSILAHGLHHREGCVVRTNPERFDEYLGRMCLKLIGETYLLRKYDEK